MKYARYSEERQRRENWKEIVDRNVQMHVEKYPHLKQEIEDAYQYVYDKKILPSMRSLQFAGKPIEVNPSRVYNCCFLPVDSWEAFPEIMFLLLGGTGVGFSVQSHHVEKLPEIRKPNPDRKRRFLVGDSIEGWADAIRILMKAYFFGKSTPVFDFSDIRPKGAKLITAGGKAPGPGPLKECVVKIENILNEKQDGEQLTPLEVHDIVCYIADAVLAGGIRRAALISLFDMNDQQMLTAKAGAWWELNPQRSRANNSAVVLRHKVKKQDFDDLWMRVKESGAGEPGIYFTNDKDWGTNPCVEIALRPFQFCNLTEINASNIESQEDYNARAKAAAFIGTLQASYTDFHYLRNIWEKTTKRDALIGVSMTGIASMEVFKYDQTEAAEVVKSENKRAAKLLGINPAARTTCVKPAGTTSLVLGTSSGIHAWHNDYYIRRVRVGKNESIYHYILNNHPEIVEDDLFSPVDAVISIPQKAPDNAVYRTESALDFLERVKQVSKHWITPGHVKGENSHNVSATVNIKDDEWDEVALWMWENRNYYNGLSVLPADGGTYKQAPFENITEEEYYKLREVLHSINLDNIVETEDLTDLKGELACAGGACEIV